MADNIPEPIPQAKDCPLCGEKMRRVCDDHREHFAHPDDGCVLAGFIVFDDEWEAWNTRAAPKVKPLEVEERRYHKLGLGPYELCPNGPDKDGSGMWRVRYHGKVICKQIKGVERAIEWVQRHHRERILSALQ